jgi:hypothetical protein
MYKKGFEVFMVDKRHFQRVRPVGVDGCIICWNKIIPVEVDDISVGGVKLKQVPKGLIGQVGQLYLNLNGCGEIFSDFRCVQKAGGQVRLKFVNISHSEQNALINFIDNIDFPIHNLAS